MHAALRLMRFDKPIGILLLLWPTLWGLWLAADGMPSLATLFIFVTGVVVMRAAGCIINDIADRRFDGSVTRTATRPLATQEISLTAALILFASLLLVALLLVLQLNALTIELAVVGAVLATVYPFCKRFIDCPQVVLGVAFAWGIPMAFAAVTGAVPAQAWLLFAAAAVWPIAYDTLYAMVDREDDLLIGVRSTAILFGRFDVAMVVLLQVFMLALLVVLGIVLQLSTVYFLGLLGAAALFVYQYRLSRERVPARCFQAFLNNQWVGLVVFLGIVLF